MQKSLPVSTPAPGRKTPFPPTICLQSLLLTKLQSCKDMYSLLDDCVTSADFYRYRFQLGISGDRHRVCGFFGVFLDKLFSSKYSRFLV